MFGGPIERPKLGTLRQAGPDEQDVLVPGVEPGQYGHFGRDPNSNYNSQMLHYTQRHTALYNEKIGAGSDEVNRAKYTGRFHSNAERKRFRSEIHSRVQQKLNEIDDALEAKRERLRILIATDERSLYKETIQTLQEGKQLKLINIKEKTARLKAEREAERLKVVEAKRIQQYADRCEDLRPALAKKHLLESKVIQQQQIRENEARRQADKEVDAMWNDMMERDMRAKLEREKQEALDYHERMQHQKEILEMQIKGKQQAKEEERRTKEEDRIELEKVAEQVKRDQLEAHNSERQKKLRTARELKAQIAFQEKLLAERTKAEQDLENAFNYLSHMQYEKEKQKIIAGTEKAMKETALYRQYLADLEKQQKVEAQQYEKLLDEYRKMIEKKQEDAMCKVLAAKQKLLQDTIDGIAEQREFKLKLAKEELRVKEAENELLRLSAETNQRLREEQERLAACARKKYQNDLKKQIDYNNVLKERERLELERQIEAGKQEEEMYRKKLADIIAHGFEVGEKHPFRKVLEQYDCKCENPTLPIK